MLDYILTFFKTNPLVALISFIIAVYGVVHQIVTRHKDKPKKELTVYQASQCLYSKERFGLENCVLQKENDTIDELYEAVFAIINTGNQEIKGTEFAESNHLLIKCDVKDSDDSSAYGIIDYEFSYPELVSTNRIEGTPGEDKKSLAVDFEFLEKKQAIRIKIRYKGKGAFVFCSGKIIGGTVKQCKKAHALCDHNMTGNLTPAELENINAEQSGIRSLIPALLSGGIMGIIIAMYFNIINMIDEINKIATIALFILLQGIFSLVFAWAVKKDS